MSIQGEHHGHITKLVPRIKRNLAVPLFAVLLLFLSATVWNLSPRINAPSTPFRKLPDIRKLDTDRPFWFIGTISAARNLQRRTIIRQTWQQLYRNDSSFTMRFIISEAGDLWQPLVKAENNTYGDIIELSHLKENTEIANTIKSMHYFKRLLENGREYAFVTKIDDDSFLNVPGFISGYLRPIMQSRSYSDLLKQGRTIIGRRLVHGPLTYPGGQFYTMTWDVVRRLVGLYENSPLEDVAEDMLIGRLHHDAGESFDLVELPNRAAFDYYDNHARGDGTAWASSDNDAQLDSSKHAIGPGAINPHKMKDDASYLRVAACFGLNGLLERPESKSS